MTIVPMIGYTAGWILERIVGNEEITLSTTEIVLDNIAKETSNRHGFGVFRIDTGKIFNNAKLAAEDAEVSHTVMLRHCHGGRTRADLSLYIPLHQMVPQKEQ